MGPTTKNQLNHAKMGLNGLPNTVKKREISEKQLISASHFFLPHLSSKRAVEAPPAYSRSHGCRKLRKKLTLEA
jgi:hypothetical protein